MGRISGVLLEVFHLELTESFDMTDLERLVRYGLDERLGNIVAPGDFNDVVGGLLIWAEQNGRLGELAEQVAQERPGRPEIAALAQQIKSEIALSDEPDRTGQADSGYRSADSVRESAWVEIPAGEFWLGSEVGRDNEKPLLRVYLPAFQIARVPITNAQYQLFVQSTGYPPPAHWQSRNNPLSLVNHPVVYVNAHDAAAYCKWLSKITGKEIALATEAQWEKAARGDQDKREYPWGDTFDPALCNTEDSRLDGTTSVDSYPGGVSPYGVLDMCGNTWEWVGSLYRPYPYNAQDGREILDETAHVLRGGAFYSSRNRTRCAYRSWDYPTVRKADYGFRVVARV